MSECRLCQGPLTPFLDLGAMPMGNGFLKEGAEDPRFPMVIAVCGGCWTVQIERPVPLSELSRVYSNYVYVPTGATLQSHYAQLARTLREHLPQGSRVLDIGSNNGELLRDLLDLDPSLKVQGIEPGERISESARQRGVPTQTGFFNADTAKTLEKGGPYDLTTFTQVFQHLPDIPATLGLVRSLLSGEGTLFIEGRYILDTIKEGAFDTFYQELLCEYGLLSLSNVLGRHGFQVHHAVRTEAYGGSLRIWAKKKAQSRTTSASTLAAEEHALGLDGQAAYRTFGEVAQRKMQEIRSLVRSLGGTTAVYGAPSTGTTLLNCCGLGRDLIEYAVDDAPLKQGLLIPGVHIPIHAPKKLQESPPDNVLVAPWRLQEDILKKLRGFRGKIVVPLPTPKVLDGAKATAAS